MTQINQPTHEQLFDSYRGKVSREQMLDALSSTLESMEIDPEISRKAYRMRLENVIESDEYNPNKLKSGRPVGRISNDRWVNLIPKHCKPTMLMLVDDIFKMLDAGTEALNLNHLRNRITELFINMRQYNLEFEHFNKIKHLILKTLDSYNQIDLINKVYKIES